MSETNINSSNNELIENTNNNLNMINIRNNSENVIYINLHVNIIIIKEIIQYFLNLLNH